MFAVDISGSHLGNLERAKEIIDIVKKCGADAIKFQKRDCDLITDKTIKNTLWGKLQYRDYRRKLELNLHEYKKIVEYCEQIKIKFFCSVFDIKSAKQMLYFTDTIKIPSKLIKNIKLLKFCSKYYKNIILGLGYSKNYKQSIKQLKKIFLNNNVIYCHCVSKYPTKYTELKLHKLTDIPKKNRGYSSHYFLDDDIKIARKNNCIYVEKHFTLNPFGYSTDDCFSLTPRELKHQINIFKYK